MMADLGPVAVIGGTGIIGAPVVRQFVAAKVGEIRVMSRKTHNPLPGTRQFHGDLLDSAALMAAVAKCRVVIHLAALKHAGASAVDPRSYVQMNVDGTANLLEACRQQGVGRVVMASTVHVYGMPQSQLITEDHPTSPLSVYAASKLAAETVATGYANAFGLSCAMARIANVFADHHDPATVIGRAVGQALRGEDIRLRSFSPVRDFIHVDDVADAIVALAAPAPAGAEIFNVASGLGLSAGRIAELVASAYERATGRRLKISEENPGSADPVPRLVFSAERLHQRIGWSSRRSLDFFLSSVFAVAKSGASSHPQHQSAPS